MNMIKKSYEEPRACVLEIDLNESTLFGSEEKTGEHYDEMETYDGFD